MSTPKNSRDGPIRKTLLTPCRRLGLSRKIKTSVETTPSTPKNDVKSQNCVNESILTQALKQENHKKKESNIKLEACLNKPSESEMESVQMKQKTEIENVPPTPKSELIQNTTNAVKSQKNTDTVNLIESNSQQDPITYEKKKEVKVKKSLKRLSMKKRPSNEDSSDNCYSSGSIELDNLPKAKKFRTQFTDIKIDDDEISQLEQRVKIKRIKLEELKQAAIYKKIHNVEKLKELIDIWTAGCKKVFSDLLLSLQTHGNISEELLIKKFNIPDGVIDTNLSQ